jgi:hypothetical protein
MKEITVRFWENQKYGSTYGKGLYRKAHYNSTAEIVAPSAKYLLDFLDLETWVHFANSPEQLEVISRFKELPKNDPCMLASWITRYQNKQKTVVGGYAFMLLEESELDLDIIDKQNGIDEKWTLPIKPCIKRDPTKPSPCLIASNKLFE